MSKRHIWMDQFVSEEKHAFLSVKSMSSFDYEKINIKLISAAET